MTPFVQPLFIHYFANNALYCPVAFLRAGYESVSYLSALYVANRES